jgi:hypothetical protein
LTAAIDEHVLQRDQEQQDRDQRHHDRHHPHHPVQLAVDAEHGLHRGGVRLQREEVLGLCLELGLVEESRPVVREVGREHRIALRAFTLGIFDDRAQRPLDEVETLLR